MKVVDPPSGGIERTLPTSDLPTLTETFVGTAHTVAAKVAISLSIAVPVSSESNASVAHLSPIKLTQFFSALVFCVARVGYGRTCDFNPSFHTDQPFSRETFYNITFFTSLDSKFTLPSLAPTNVSRKASRKRKMLERDPSEPASSSKSSSTCFITESVAAAKLEEGKNILRRAKGFRATLNTFCCWVDGSRPASEEKS
jgi:hypothetical protein